MNNPNKKISDKTKQEISTTSNIPSQEFDIVSFLGVLKELMGNYKDFCELQRLLSKARKAKFDSLIEAGFTEEQALKIIADSKTGDLL